MPRAEAVDPLHGFRFHVTAEVDGSDVLAFTDDDGAQAGFTSVTTPELSLDGVVYREGTDQWSRKYPGISNWNDVDMMRGVMKSDTTFADWTLTAAQTGEYRADLTIFHWHRDGKTPGKVANLADARKYRLFEAFPIRAAFAGQLDSQSSEISLSELSVSYEYAEIEDAS